MAANEQLTCELVASRQMGWESVVKDQLFPGFWGLVPRTKEAHTDYNVTKDFIQKQNDNTDQTHGKGVEGSLR